MIYMYIHIYRSLDDVIFEFKWRLNGVQIASYPDCNTLPGFLKALSDSFKHHTVITILITVPCIISVNK